MTITFDSIIKKLGFNPLRHTYCTNDYEDDNWVNPFQALTVQEIQFLFDAAISDPNCRASVTNK